MKGQTRNGGRGMREDVQPCSNFQGAEKWLEAGSKSKSVAIDHHVKMPNKTAEINIFTAWSKKQFWSQ